MKFLEGKVPQFKSSPPVSITEARDVLHVNGVTARCSPVVCYFSTLQGDLGEQTAITQISVLLLDVSPARYFGSAACY